MHPLIFANLVTLQTSVAAAATAKPLDPWQLMLEASPVVKLVLVLLVLMSIACWFIIGAKLVHLGRAARQSTRFLGVFWESDRGPIWNAQRLESIYGQLKIVDGSPLAKIFHAGYLELARMAGAGIQAERQSGIASMRPPGDIHNVERALRRAQVNELTSLESMVPFLATTGSTAPFVGLFGTVWGIMASFIAIGGQHNASLDVVAPGIAEALIATAIGLAAAIPAVMAYNYFVRRIRVLESEMDAFASDYLNIVRRHLLVS